MAELEVMQADVTKLEVDAIANAANTQLRHGGGVAGAISRAGGPEVQRESDERAPIGLGDAVETTAGRWAARPRRRSSSGRRARRWRRPRTSAVARSPWWPSGRAWAASRSTTRRA